MKAAYLILLAMFASLLIGCQHTVRTSDNYRPHTGYVPNPETAVQIAEAVLLPIYGKEQVESERPFVANLNGDIWTVEGSLPDGWLGGVAEVDIRKSDGKIMRLIHGE